MTSPADELRAATLTLRERATTALANPFNGDNTQHWSCRLRATNRTDGFPPTATITSDPDLGKSIIHGGGGRTGRGPWVFAAHGEYIALMDPALGLLFADWLDVAVDLIDDYPDLGHIHIDGEPCTDLACRTVHAALAVARQINGTETTP
ncbi:hypothetical protein [Streptomyces niveus]|uniref:hypothetical protein n=1 Tax=Streptomyces niveus TaxID=193462 RepID=UPI00084C3A0D|nr:hypothetical protein [Streptomyces niveus]